jgi:hypothetical protein
MTFVLNYYHRHRVVPVSKTLTPYGGTHIALDDAKGQGALLCNMLADRQKRFGM